MVLVGADEHHRAACFGDVSSSEYSREQWLGDADPQEPDQFVDGGRRARAYEHHDVVVGGVDRATYDGSRVFT